MAFSHELEAAIRSYVDRYIGLDDLQDWLNAHVQAAGDSADPVAIELSDHAWILLSEFGYGYRPEESVRAELGKLLWAGLAPRISQALSPPTTARGVRLLMPSTFQPSAVPFRPCEILVARFP